MTAIRKHLTDFAAIIGLVVVALSVSVYILHNERLRFPVVEQEPFHLKAEFSTAQAVTPGQGQTVRVSGVRIGDIAKTELKDGVAIVTLDIDPKYSKLVHTDATALLRPKTGLKDMFVALNPGSNAAPVAKGGWTIPVQNTLPDINPDEVYQFLDADSRDYLKLLVNGAGRGLAGRGLDLQDVFRRFEPIHRDLASVTTAVAVRHANLKHLITKLNVLNTALAGKSTQLASLVDTSAQVFRAFASEDQNISRAVRDLPGALHQTTQTLNKVTTYAGVLGTASERLRPAFRSLNVANHKVIPFATEAAPILRDKIRPFVREAQPLVNTLKPAAKNLAKATPGLTGSFKVLNNLFNMVGYNPKGTEAPGVAGRDEGFLFWLAWLNHDGGALFGSSDANGPFRPVTFSVSCQTLKEIADEQGANAVYSLVFSKPLFDAGVCK
ncbi:MAG: phospholipid/cholesterol/gamma-HCH transport system substrate-binding protein [Solirubrobacteraceae bacterium]|nr:phospholipid/cholesterol/gamma-HCH transport system substrate-binding protein [Solirubrobacteraceae bacterium]